MNNYWPSSLRIVILDSFSAGVASGKLWAVIKGVWVRVLPGSRIIVSREALWAISQRIAGILRVLIAFSSGLSPF